MNRNAYKARSNVHLIPRVLLVIEPFECLFQCPIISKKIVNIFRNTCNVIPVNIWI